jgi:hypothetical protein
VREEGPGTLHALDLTKRRLLQRALEDLINVYKTAHPGYAADAHGAAMQLSSADGLRLVL